jgi:hypothetical protein
MRVTQRAAQRSIEGNISFDRKATDYEISDGRFSSDASGSSCILPHSASDEGADKKTGCGRE